MRRTGLKNSGKLAVVTGGGRGIGLAITRRLTRSGWICLIADLNVEGIDTLSCHLHSEEGKVVPHQCDISTQPGRDSLIHETERIGGELALLVNCAARSDAQPLFKQRLDRWNAELATNLTAVALLSSWAIGRMRLSGGGVVINIGSIYGSLGLNSHFYQEVYPQDGADGPMRTLPYHASKGALGALTRELAAVGGQWNVRVNMISPGMIATPERDLSQTFVGRISEATPLQRIGRPEDIAPIVEFLASSDASFVTGAEWIVDGGWSIW